MLGYALYATVFDTLGALASRPEDAQSAAGPVNVVLIAAHFVSFAAIRSPSSAWAKAVSIFPATAPLAMPNRIAMGATTWWEPVAAVILTLVAILAPVQFGGRVYTGGILHSGPALKFRDAWQGTTARHNEVVVTDTPPIDTKPRQSDTGQRDLATGTTGRLMYRRLNVALIGVAVPIAAAVFVLFDDAVIGIAVGASCCAIANRIVKARAGRTDRHCSPK